MGTGVVCHFLDSVMMVLDGVMMVPSLVSSHKECWKYEKCMPFFRWHSGSLHKLSFRVRDLHISEGRMEMRCPFLDGIMEFAFQFWYLYITNVEEYKW